MKKIGLIVFSAVGALISRFHGGGFKGGVNKSLKNALWALPFSLCCYTAFYLNNLSGALVWALIAISFFGCLLKATGHGGGMDLGRSEKEPGNGRSLEKVEYLIHWLYPHLSRFWYDFLILVLAGIAAVLGGIIAFSYLNPLYGIIIAIGGAMKGVAYAIGWKIYPEGSGPGIKHFNEATQIGEALTGFFAYGGLFIATLLSIT